MGEEEEVRGPRFQAGWAGPSLVLFMVRRMGGLHARKSLRCILNPCRGFQSWCQGWRGGPLAGVAASSATEAAQASQAVAVAKAAGGDGHSLGAEGAAHGSRGGGSDGGALGEGAEDGSWQGDHHGGRLDDDAGVLALPDTGLVAAVSQRGGSAGAAEIVAGHVCGVEGPWKRGC